MSTDVQLKAKHTHLGMVGVRLQEDNLGSVVGESRHASCVEVLLYVLHSHDIAVYVLSNLHIRELLSPRALLGQKRHKDRDSAGFKTYLD